MQCWFMQGDVKLNPLSFEKDHYNRSCGDLCNVTLGVEWQFWYGDNKYLYKIVKEYSVVFLYLNLSSEQTVQGMTYQQLD